MSNQTIIECCICMDDIIGDKNKTTTECGHIFHCSCLMKNTAHNGYGCPYCRTVMAEPIVDTDDEDDYEQGDDDDDDNDDDNDDDDDNALTSFRMFHQTISGDEIEDEPELVNDDDDDDNDNDYIIEKPTTEYIANKLIGQGVSVEDLVKCLLIEHSEYEDDYQYERSSSSMFGRMRILISNYTPTPTPPPTQPINLTIRITSNGHRSVTNNTITPSILNRICYN